MKKNTKLAIHIEQDPNENDFPTQQNSSQPLRPITLPDSDEEKPTPQSSQRPGKVIQFEEFLVEDESDVKRDAPNVKKSSLTPTERSYADSKQVLKGRREFLIDIPEGRSTRNKFSVDSGSLQKEEYREPPAPSNKKSIKAKNFIFPPSSSTVPEESSPQQQQQGISVQELLRSFDRERQQFCREKSNFQKELLVKEGQIEMLQRMLTGRIGNSEEVHNYQYFETLILQKDLQVNSLLERISELGKQAATRAEELREARGEVSRLENLNASLMHQLYLLEQKEANKKTTQQFYEIKRKPHTPTARNWDYEHKDEIRYSGLSDLQKRIDNLKSNRIDLQERKRIKSELNYTQPARYKPTYDPYQYKANKF